MSDYEEPGSGSLSFGDAPPGAYLSRGTVKRLLQWARELDTRYVMTREHRRLDAQLVEVLEHTTGDAPSELLYSHKVPAVGKAPVDGDLRTIAAYLRLDDGADVNDVLLAIARLRGEAPHRAATPAPSLWRGVPTADEVAAHAARYPVRWGVDDYGVWAARPREVTGEKGVPMLTPAFVSLRVEGGAILAVWPWGQRAQPFGANFAGAQYDWRAMGYDGFVDETP